MKFIVIIKGLDCRQHLMESVFWY